METAIENPGKRARVLLSIGKEAVSSLGRKHTKLVGQDGGGVRGLSALLILEYLMERINEDHDPPKQPWEVFDLIGGTSTGGLIAIMLGRLKMDIASCIKAYLGISASVFEPKRNRMNMFGRLKDRVKTKEKFDSKRLEGVIKDSVRLALKDEDTLFEESSEPSCRVFVCALRGDTGRPVLLRSYQTRSATAVKGCRIWEAGRATSAATSFFDPITIGEYSESFVDGATGCNNPVRHVLDEACEIWTPETKAHALIISIGTGQPSMKAFGRGLKEVAKTLITIATETENTNEEFLSANQDLRQQKRYFRFNVTKGLENIGLEEYSKKNIISSATNHYLNEQMTRDKVDTFLGSFKRSSSDQLLLGIDVGGNTAAGDITCLSKEEKECLASFSLADYSTYRKRVSKRHPGTLEWLLDDERYKTWIAAKSSFLWISGNPGCGKTVLSAFLLDQLDKITKNTNIKVVYFFCDDKDESQKTAQALLRGVIHQLLLAAPRLIKHAMLPWTAQKASMLTSLDTLWNIFLAIATDSTSGGTYCVLDALDECEESSREYLLDQLGQHFTSTGNRNQAGYMKIILTSRPYESINCHLKKFLTVRLKTEDEEGHINKDISGFIQYEVKRLAENRGYSQKLETEVRKTLEKGSDGMFLWVSLIIKDLESTRTSDVETKLKTLPLHLNDLYTYLLMRMDDNIKEMAKRVLLWVVTAVRPLKLKELAIALNIKPNDTSGVALISSDDLKSFKKDIDLYGPILKVQGGVVHLVHQSAKEFMTNSANVIFPPPLSTFRISSAEANFQLAITCMTYLSFDEFDEGPLHSDSRYEVYKPFQLRLQEHPFLEYAASHWTHHAMRGDEENVDMFNFFLKLSKSKPKFDLACQTLRFLTSEMFSSTPPLQVCSEFGIYSFARQLLDEGADINAQGGEYGNALQAAADGGHGAVVKLLLDRGADVNAQGGMYRNALQAAADGGHGAVVKLLLDRGADVNAQGGEYGNALQAAALGGYEVVVKLLLDRGADVNAQGGVYGNALLAAVLGGHEAVVKLLLDRGAGVNAQGGFYGNALQAARSKGHGAVAKLLPDRGADIDL